MSKRYYYTDPLAAAWMAKHFGMKVTGPVVTPTGEIYESSQPMPVWIISRIIEQKERVGDKSVDKFYIHPDSLGILEPQVGDMMLCLGYGGDKDIGLVVEDRADMGLCDEKIIQRNGVAFIYPEVEHD